MRRDYFIAIVLAVSAIPGGVALMAAPEYLHLSSAYLAVTFWGGITLTILLVTTAIIMAMRAESSPPIRLGGRANLAKAIGFFSIGFITCAILFFVQQQNVSINSDHKIINPAEAAPPSRVFVPPEITAKRLFSFYEGNTDSQAAELAKPYIGRWMKVVGTVAAVSPSRITFDHVLDRQTLDLTIIDMYFNDVERIDSLKILQRGDKITVIGRITEVQRLDIRLDECELDHTDDGRLLTR